jgi:hypothetical protein
LPLYRCHDTLGNVAAPSFGSFSKEAAVGATIEVGLARPDSDGTADDNLCPPGRLRRD